MNMNMARCLTILTVSVVVCFTAACGKTQSATPADSSPADIKAIEVSTTTAQILEVPVSIDTTGTFEATESSDLSPAAEGIVVATPVDIGAPVKSGDVVVRLDDRDARLRLEQAEALVEQAEASLRQAESRIGAVPGSSFDPARVPEVQAAQASYASAKARTTLAESEATRYAELFRSGDVSRSSYEKYKAEAESAKSQEEAAKQQYDAALNAARQGFQGVGTAQAALASAKAQRAMAQKGVHDMVVRAPFAGQITARPIAVGEYVSKSSKLVTVVRSNPLKLQLQMPEANASRIRLGLRVLARVAAYPGQEFTGEVRAINPAIDVNSRTLMVEVHFQNPEFKLKPGMFSTATVQLEGTEKVVFVPPDAIVDLPGLESAQVFVIDSGVARARVVQPGGISNGMVRVLSGLSGGEAIATTNLDKLYDGVAVRQ
jgi:multidrug efflux pump subunit AcrA (membrane-fusion protein)